MNKTRWFTGSVLLSSILVFSFGTLSINATEAWNTQEHNEKGEHKGTLRESQTSTTRFKKDTLYAEECGACHLAYPPNLLPQESWKKVMGGLEDHFGENAELDAQTNTHIAQYLDQQGLRKNKSGKQNRMLRNIPKDAPIKITALPYFIAKHDEIPSKMLKNNPKLSSLSQCDKCHSKAVDGLFDEDQVVIPGYGRWDD